VPLGPTPALAAGTPAVAQAPLALAPEVLEKLHGVARATGAPIKSVLLAAHLKALGALTGQSAVTTGLLINGRPEELGGERLLGAFLNTAPFALDLGRGSWNELVRRVLAAERELLPFRRFPIQELERLHGAQSLINTVFNFTHFHVYQRLEPVRGLEVLGGGGSEQTLRRHGAVRIDRRQRAALRPLDYRTLEVSSARPRSRAATSACSRPRRATPARATSRSRCSRATSGAS
jgi:hypothetical protein